MKNLREYLEQATRDKTYYDLESTQDFLKNLAELHLFKVDLSCLGTTDVTESDVPENLSIPFEDCWFDLTKSIRFSIPSDIHNGDFKEAVINGFGIKEITPDYHRLFAAAGVLYKGLWYSMPFNCALYEGGRLGMGASAFKEVYEILSNTLLIIAQQVENKLQNKHFTIISGSDKLDIKARVGRNLVRYKYKPNRIIYVTNIQDFKTKFPNLKDRIIKEPKYSWEVMGHWRKLNNPKTLGKNRQGEYVVENYTWVVPYVKGEGELMKKVRIVK